MNYLQIRSKGEIDIQASTLIGASTKTGDSSKIGMYGSGNKYAISALLRQKISFKVFSGESEIIFSTSPNTFRDKAFDVILVNGQTTSLTTTMGGRDWDGAFPPLREIYSNALDEDSDATLRLESEAKGSPGYTTFYIEMTSNVSHFYENKHLYFCKTNPDVVYSNAKGSIYENREGKCRLFRRGILAHYSDKEPSIFYYNLSDLEINESRVVRSESHATVCLAYLLKSCSNPDIISRLIFGLAGSNTGMFEHRVYWEAWQSFNEAWQIALRGKKLVPVEYLEMFERDELIGTIKLPVNLLRELKKDFPDLDILGLSAKSDDIYSTVKPSQILVDKVLDALSALSKTRYKHRILDVPIKYVNFSTPTVLAKADLDDRCVLLSTKLDSEDVNKIAKILIEEYEHLHTGYEDCSRTFQNHLFNLYFDQLIS